MSNTEHLGVTELQDLLDTGGSPAVVQHLGKCVECRIRAARLARHVGVAGPSSAALDRILTAETYLSPPIIEAAGTHLQAESPAAGELWRVGNGDVLLVWVRRVRAGVTEVMPAVLDVELADDHTLLLPATATVLGLELGLVTSVRGHIHPDAFLARVDTLDATVASKVSELMRAVNDGTAPADAVVGAPIHDADDQRIEFQQTLADLLADFGPGAWSAAQQGDREEFDRRGLSGEDAELVEQLRAELPERHPCTILRSLRVEAPLAAGPSLRAVARVSYANAIVIVAVRPQWNDVENVDLAAACGSVVRQEPGAVAVAVCGDDAERLALIFETRSLSEAYVPPTGVLQPPQPLLGPMGLIDALHKYLSTSAPTWEDVDTGQDVMATDLSAAIRIAAGAAVAHVIAQGSRAHITAKKQAWQSLPPASAERIADALEQIVAGEPAAVTIQRLLEGGTP